MRLGDGRAPVPSGLWCWALEPLLIVDGEVQKLPCLVWAQLLKPVAESMRQCQVLQAFVGFLLVGPSDSVPSDFVVGVSARRLEMDSTSVSTHRTRAWHLDTSCIAALKSQTASGSPTDPIVTKACSPAREVCCEIDDDWASRHALCGCSPAQRTNTTCSTSADLASACCGCT